MKEQERETDRETKRLSCKEQQLEYPLTPQQKL